MLSLGLDLSERPARAVVVDEAGEVLARGSGADGAEAVRDAARRPRTRRSPASRSSTTARTIPTSRASTS